MPHQCVRCNTFYGDGDAVILEGCNCGGKLFLFVKKDKIEDAKKIVEVSNLSAKDKKQIEEDVFDLVGSDIDRDQPVVLDVESIRVLRPGKYELDLVHMFKGEPLIFKLEEGKYMVDIIQSFKKLDKKK
jgi:predicted  nucleic acid-binding Zn-ribbon protein